MWSRSSSGIPMYDWEWGTGTQVLVVDVGKKGILRDKVSCKTRPNALQGSSYPSKQVQVDILPVDT